MIMHNGIYLSIQYCMVVKYSLVYLISLFETILIWGFKRIFMNPKKIHDIIKSFHLLLSSKVVYEIYTLAAVVASPYH